MIGCLVIIKDETHRYLEAMLTYHSMMIDDLFVVDDGSTDSSYDIASLFTERVVKRPDHVPSFLEDESALRAWAWKAAGDNLELNEQDWLLLLDADEFFIPEMGLTQIQEDAESLGMVSVRFKMPEVWKSEPGQLSVRTDGFWARNRNVRFVRYRRDAGFAAGKMGGGSVPRDYLNHKILDTNDVILHFGYLHPDDRVEKYQRYKTSKNVHSPTHIDSIVTTPTLEHWKGPVPEWWRGLSE